MKQWSSSLSSATRARTVPMLAMLWLLALPAASLADESCTGASATSVCDETSALAKDLMRRRVSRTLAVGPASDRLDLLKTPGTAAVTPFVMTPDGGNANFTTSLSQWSSSLSAADREKLKAASEASGENLPLPQPVQDARKFDLWAKGRREAFGKDGRVTKEGSAVSTFMGADYRLDKDLLIGGMLQVDEAHQTILAAPDAVEGSAYMAGPYFAYRVTPHIVFNAKTAWGNAQDNAIAGSASEAFATQRMLSEAKVSGQWGWEGWQLSQSGAVTYLDETSIGLAGASETSVDVTRLSVGPEVKRRFQAGENLSIEPFAFFKSSVDVAETGLADPSALNTIGGGVTLAEPDSYSIRATADYSEHTESTNPGEAKGKVSVSVPTSILGF